MRTLIQIYDNKDPQSVKIVSVRTDEDYASWMRKVIRFADSAGITDEGRTIEVIGQCEFLDDKVHSL